MSKKLYFWNDWKLKLLRERYDGRVKGRARDIARVLGVTKRVVNRKASDMGLARVKERPWSPVDLAYLARHYHRVRVQTIAKRLGRSKIAIELKAKRQRYRKLGEGYTANSLAMALGVDSHWVTRRIKERKLTASYRNTNRTAAQGNDAYLITEESVVAFVTEHTHELDLRRIDPLWFLDLIHQQLALVPNRKGNGGHGRV